MTATIANVDAALKNDYQPAIREQLVNSWMLLAQVGSNTKDVQGRYAVLSLHVSRNSGVGGRARGAALPAAGAQGYAEERVPTIANYARIAIHGDLIEASSSDKGAFARMLQAELDGALTDMKNDVSRQLYGDATKSILQCGTTSAAALIVLTNPTNIQLRQVHVGMLVDIGTTSDYDVVVAGAQITAVDRSAGTITIDSAVTTSSSHYVTRAGSDGNELTGLREIVAASGTLFNVAPGTVPEWVSTVNANGAVNRTPTENLFETVIEDVHFESDSDVNMICTTRGVRRAFAATLQSQKRFTNTVDVKGGFSAVTIAAGNVEIPLVVDNDSPANMAFFLNTKHLTQHQMGNAWSFMDRDGSVLHYVPGFDQYEAVIYNYHELTTDRRNAHGLATDLTEA
jgi:rhodanese-related sulfurtransferase